MKMALQPHTPPGHPGEHIKREVLPRGVSVKKAAEIMDVGRPALSNLLNGNASLTPEMAVRLEKAFGADAQGLMALQSAYDDFQRREQAKDIAVRAFVPSFLAIEARQVAAWSDQIRARSEMPALVRRLVHSTAKNLMKVDFPAYDNSQRPGWDGYVSTDEATPWIPRGTSGWEFGCNENPARKAEQDYAARTASVPPEERKDITFIFVTPKNWTGKNSWAQAKHGKREWKEVRAYDGSDLEQWLEQSVAAQVWFAEKLGSGTLGIATLEQCWKRWAAVTDPPLSKILFRGSIERHADTLRTWLNQPAAQPLVITADSEIEALAFITCAFETLGTPPGQFYDRAVVLETVDAFKRVAATARDFVAVVSSSQVELVSAGLQKTHHTMIVRRHNDITGEPDIALDLVDYQTFREALGAMGLPGEDYERYARETGHSPTVLRRRLSHMPAIRAPAWSTDTALAQKLVPLNFAGVWNSATPADCEIMGLLATKAYADVERAVTELSRVADAPVWSVGNVRGVTSKIDILFATHTSVTKEDLETFFFVAQYVLSESDPALDLPPDKRWAANIYGKTRDHSAVLRRGICETLVLLAVHGNALFGERLGINLEGRVDAIIRNLLTPLDGRTWASHRGDLPRYAEASPNVFLDLLDQDLASPEPKVHELFRPADTTPFSECPRTGILWALETLAWKPERLGRISSILAKLATIRIEDNWANKPEASLGAIYSSWVPQTAASIDDRNAALESLCQRFPEVGWRLCLAQFDPHSTIGHYSARPHWRNDASGAGQPVKTMGEIHRAASKALQLALAWPHHTEKTLGDLVERLEGIHESEHGTVWDLIKIWAATNPSDTAKQDLRERVRRFAFTRRAQIRGVAGKVANPARELYELLRPADLIMRHLWLFARDWVDESIEDIQDEDEQHFDKHEERIGEQRKAALQEIWAANGYAGMISLCELGNAEGVIGWQLADIVEAEQRIELIDRLAGHLPPPESRKVDQLLSSFLRRLDSAAREKVVTELLEAYSTAGTMSADKSIRILKCLPFRAATWKHVEALPTNLRERYWRETYVVWEQQNEHELNTIVDRLLEVGRARAALRVSQMGFDKVSTARMITLLRTVATSSSEAADTFRLNQYEISRAFKSLKKRSGMLPETLAQLEFMYAEVLDHSDYGIPTLESEVATQPQLFMQLISLVYKRRDDGQDPPEWRIADDERHAALATTCYSVLKRTRRIPGTQPDGSVDGGTLIKWIEDVRALARGLGRLESAEYCIGELLAQSPGGSDGVWPCEAVRQTLDALASQDIARGLMIGRFNSRGAHWRGPGGQEERDLAAQYRSWAKALTFQWPFTAKTLEEIAQTYDREAVQHDTDANVRKRLNF
jgi:addiction module HigA family antidote